MPSIVNWGRFAQCITGTPFWIAQDTPTPVKVTVYESPDWRTSRDMHNAFMAEQKAVEEKPNPVSKVHIDIQGYTLNLQGLPAVIANIGLKTITTPLYYLFLPRFKYGNRLTIRYAAKDTDETVGVYLYAGPFFQYKFFWTNPDPIYENATILAEMYRVNEQYTHAINEKVLVGSKEK